MSALEPLPILVIGRFRAEERSRLAVAADQSVHELCLVDSSSEAEAWLQAHSPNAVLVDTIGVSPEQVAFAARAQTRHAAVPIIAIARDLSDLSFASAFNWGAEDVVTLFQVRPLLARLRGLPRNAPEPVSAGRGAALVAEPDHIRRVLLGRVLRNAGYSVTFAVTAEDAERFVSESELALIVLNTELGGDVRETMSKAEAQNANAFWIVTCPPKELRTHRQALEGVPLARAMDGYSPPENVLFVANELRGGAQNQRASARILYGTSTAFRGAGRHEDDVGYTYNVSATGLYVRTLCPPQDEDVWLELCPPRTERRVRLVGRVAWRRRFGWSDSATVPPGFGAQIVDGARADLDAWRLGYEALAEALG